VKIQKTTQPFPDTDCRPPQDGLEKMFDAEIHVALYTGGGSQGWRAIVKPKTGSRYCIEGRTPLELGKAMAMAANEHMAGTSGYSQPTPKDAEIEAPLLDARYLADGKSGNCVKPDTET
jgi:hypothetical protein